MLVEGGRRVHEPTSLVMRRDNRRSCNHRGREQQRCGASALGWRNGCSRKCPIHGVSGRSCHRRVHIATKSPPSAVRPRCHSAAARSPDGRVVCVGVMVPWVRRGHRSSAEIWRPPAQEVDKGGGDLASASRDECCPWKLQGMCAKRRPLRRAWGGGRK